MPGRIPPIIIHSIYFLVSFTFCFLYYQKIVASADFSSPNGIYAVLSFETVKPYQFRILVPLLFKALSVISFIPPKALYMLMNFSFVYLIILTFYYFLNEHFNNYSANLFLSMSIIYPMVWNYVLLNQTFQYYDLLSVLLFTLGLYFIVRKKFSLLLLTFIVGILNRETIAYLIFAYLFFNYKTLFRAGTIFKTIILASAFIIIKSLLVYVFRNNHGDVFEGTYLWNIEFISGIFKTNRIYIKNIFLNFGLLYVFAFLLFLTGRWKKFPNLPLLSLNLTILPFLLLGIFLVYFTEVRVYAELIPLFTALFLIYLSTFEMFGLRPKLPE